MTSVWILGDQLLDPHPAMARARADGARVEIVMVESARRLRRLPNHKRKLVLLLSGASTCGGSTGGSCQGCGMATRGRRAAGCRATGYTHHIERLMLLANFCLLAGVRPRAVTDWFLAAYVDACDWVMQPNVMGMGFNADGGLVATKPYVASAAYIDRMSDYCGECRYDSGRRAGPDACPFNTLYWNFLLTHERRLRANPRLGPAVLGLRRLGAAGRRAVRASAQGLLARLDRA